MKKSLTLLAFTLLLSAFATAQPALIFRDSLNFPFRINSNGSVGTSDCWGWTDSQGVDYAILGNYDNIAFVRASDNALLDMEVAPDWSDPYYHRDMVTYGNYCYVVSEMTGTRQGLMIFDLSPLPDSVRWVKSWTNNFNIVICHNMDVDTATGYIYLQDNSAVDIVDVNDPENPVKVGSIAASSVHDMHARNDTLWVAQGYSGRFSIWDVSDKSNPVKLGEVVDPNFGYCHNIWPSEDGKYFITTEENTGKTIKIWDATDMNNIVLSGTYLGSNNLAHNVHVMGDLIFASHYSAGVTVVDFSNPNQPVEIASYDTYPQSNSAGFFGCWGVFPYTNNGYVYATNFGGELFILEWHPNGVSVDEGETRGPDLIYPNPFNQVTNIPFELEEPARTTVEIYDLSGRRVARLLDRELEAGKFVVPWRPDPNTPAGTYLVQLNSGDLHTIKKVEFFH